MIKISIIIPVYNAELHLEKCIHSLVKQTLQEIEFIFVNDGSTDNSQKCIEKFKANDDRIILLNQNNEGVSVARNNGIKIAQGLYIGFVDADDYIENNYFETLYNAITKNNLDIVVAKYHSTQDNHHFISNTLFEENTIYNYTFIQKNIIETLIKTDKLNAIWNKLYKKEIITQNTITFPKGIALGEDGWFNLNYFFYAKNVMFLDYAGYYYRDVVGSATRDSNSIKYFKRIEQNYLEDFSGFQNSHITIQKINFFKAQKYFTKVIALLHQYNNSKNTHLINSVIYGNITRQIVNQYYKQLYLQSTKYERGFLIAFKYKMPIIVRFLTAYSNFRNKK